MNNITLIGKIGRDPETRQVGSNTVAKFSLATSRSYTNKQGEKVTDTSWHEIEAWGKQAEVIAKYCQKGHKLAVIGELRYDKYTNKDGQEVTRAKIVLQSFEFLQPRDGSTSAQKSQVDDGASWTGDGEPWD